MASSSDVMHFDHKAPTYDEGRKGRWNQRVVSRAADVAMASAPVPIRALDVGCGTGSMLVEFAVRLPTAVHVGVDPSRGMLLRARERSEGRAELVRAGAEALPFATATFDLVVSTLSMHHWAEPERSLREIARVLTADGSFVLADFCGWWQREGGGLRHRGKIVRLAKRCGFELERRETISRTIGLPRVQAFVFAK